MYSLYAALGNPTEITLATMALLFGVACVVAWAR
jgi:hypothetical protein